MLSRLSLNSRPWLLLACLSGALTLPGIAAAQVNTYASYTLRVPYQPLPDDVPWAVDENGKTTGPFADIAWNSDPSWVCGIAQGCPGADLSLVDIQLPDDFHYRLFGTEYPLVQMSSEGAVTNPNSYLPDGNDNYGKFPRGVDPNGFIAAWWDTWVRSALDSPNPGGMKWTIDGTGDDQVLKMEWVNFTQNECMPSFDFDCHLAANYSFQIWVYTATGTRDSLIRFFYASAPIPLNGQASGTDFGDPEISGSVGLESDDGQDGMMVLACTPNCTHDDWPPDTMIELSEGPDLVVTSVTGPREGWTGVTTTMGATAANIGAQDASNVGMRFWMSEDSSLDPLVDLPVGTDPPDLLGSAPDPAGLKKVTSLGGTTAFSFTGPLPADLPSSSYFIVAEVNPATDTSPGGLADDATRANNTAAYGPFPIGPPTADLAVGDINVDSPSAPPGATFTLTWTARNIGNLAQQGIDYLVVLSSDSVITASDNVIGSGTISSLDALTDLPWNDEIQLKNDLRPGAYYLGIVLDPTNTVTEIDEFNNTGVLGQPFLVGGGDVQIVSAQLTGGYLGAPYCERLEAAGGNGVYSWSLPAGSTPPPGLSLREEPDGASAKGLPFETLLCGVPSALGNFTFAVQVTSNGSTAQGNLSMAVTGHAGVLAVVTEQLPDATFLVPYEAHLMASGGVPPYHWSLLDGAPTSGLTLSEDGAVTGAPLLDGPSPFTVQVLDSSSPPATASRKIQLSVTPPGRLTCVQQRLPDGPVMADYSANLEAAGGQKPYTFSNVESRRLATTVGDDGDSMAGAAPPGLVLSQTGKVSGSPSQGGTYLWTVKVTDKNLATDTCILAVNFLAGTLELSTSGLPAACVGQAYSVQLQASGGLDSFKTWSLDGNSTLPPGLTLSADGVLSGTLGDELLLGDPQRTFNFTVRVKDAQNAQGVGGVALTVDSSCAPVAVPQTVTKKTGCQSGTGAPSLLALAGLAALALRRRRW